jgi:hypothetical protein
MDDLNVKLSGSKEATLEFLATVPWKKRYKFHIEPQEPQRQRDDDALSESHLLRTARLISSTFPMAEGVKDALKVRGLCSLTFPMAEGVKDALKVRGLCFCALPASIARDAHLEHK